MDELRARAYLDLLLGKDSRPGGPGEDGAGTAADAASRAGFAGRVTLTVPLATLAGAGGPARRAGRAGPGRPVAGPGPGRRGGQNPKTTWCVTVTDGQGHAVAHGCARPEPKGHEGNATRDRGTRRRDPGRPGGFSFTPAGRDGPPGGYGTWRLTTPGDGPDLIIELDPLTTEPCDHRFRPGATIPGSSSGTCPRSGTPPAPARSAAGPPPSATSSTTSPTKRAAGPACATPARSAGMTTGSSSTPGGRWTSSPTGPSGGPHPPDAPTPPNPPATPSDGRQGATATRHSPGGECAASGRLFRLAGSLRNQAPRAEDRVSSWPT